MTRTNSVNGLVNLLVGGAVLVAIAWWMVRKPSLDIDPPQDEWFQTEVVRQSQPVLVKFGATWCGPCRSTDKALEEYRESNASPIPIVHIDVDQRPQLASHYRVRAIPRMFIFHHGRMLDDQSGGMDAKAIERWVASSAQLSSKDH
ncbi:MAG: thioredoxin family protein [Pirellula sp.]